MKAEPDEPHPHDQRAALPVVRDPDGIESGIVGVRVGSSDSVVTLRFENFVLT